MSDPVTTAQDASTAVPAASQAAPVTGIVSLVAESALPKASAFVAKQSAWYVAFVESHPKTAAAIVAGALLAAALLGHIL